jgi:hypothetical protein
LKLKVQLVTYKETATSEKMTAIAKVVKLFRIEEITIRSKNREYREPL